MYVKHIVYDYICIYLYMKDQHWLKRLRLKMLKMLQMLKSKSQTPGTVNVTFISEACICCRFLERTKLLE